MRHIPEKRQSIRPPASITPLLMAVAFVLVLMAVVISVAVAR
jgi:hypothetical protein